MKKIIVSIGILGVSLIPGYSQTYVDALKLHTVRVIGDFGIGSSYEEDYSFNVEDNSNSQQRFGIEYGYSFWHSGAQSLQINAGFLLAPTNFNATVENINYSYQACPEADMDGDPYVRYVELSNLHQTSKVLRMEIPVYLKYDYRFASRFSVYGKAGVFMGFGGKAKVKTGSARVYSYSYGVYPGYGDLLMDDEWLNDFGERHLNASNMKGEVNTSTDIGVLIGAGLSFKVAEPVVIILGLNYSAGLNDIVKPGNLSIRDGVLSADEVPVSYTVADGQTCRPLLEGITKSKLMRLGIDVGVEVNF